LTTEMENRRHPRFAVALPLVVRLGDGASTGVPRDAEPPEHETLSRDLSTSGIYFSLPQPCQLGSSVECVLTLPPDSQFGKSAQIRFRGKVVRVEKPDGGRIGVAAVIENYVFNRGN
jgi:hypothetical protein